jgi:hypothetical protein
MYAISKLGIKVRNAAGATPFLGACDYPKGLGGDGKGSGE